MSLGRATRWIALRDELARWRQAGEIARLWLRDDDAVSVTPALERLTDLCAAHAVPYLVAAIPSRADEGLAVYLADQPLAEIAAHGWSHRNHAAAAKAEFPIDRPRGEIVRDLTEARMRIETLFGAKAVPIYVPPWNRIAPEVAALLPLAGFRAVSALGRARSALPPLPEVNVHLDVIDWRGSRGGRDPDTLANELAAHLSSARENGWSATGILTHHLDHDAVAWRFLEDLFAETADHAGVRWVRVSELLRSAAEHTSCA